MITRQDKIEKLRPQVISKIHWSAPREEVETWLAEEHGVSGDEAKRLIEEGYRARRRAIRQRAIMRLVLSVIGISLMVIYAYVRSSTGRIFPDPVSALSAVLIGLFSIWVFIRSVIHLVTGDTNSTVD